MVGLIGPASPATRLGRAARVRSAAPVPRALLLRLLRPDALLWIVIVAILVLPIALFLLVAFSPAMFQQGTDWFSVAAFGRALQGSALVGLADSTGVGLAAAVLATVVGGALAWVAMRTDAVARQAVTGLVFALFLTPSYLIALGWQRLIEPNGVLQVLGADPSGFRGVFYGPVGVVTVLAVKGMPFAYLAISNAVRGLGSEFEDAARVHGGGPLAAARLTVQLLAPAVWSSLAIVFAESVSDFGVADTLANAAHFPVATYALYSAVQAFPVDFPLASAVSWLLLLLVLAALALQGRVLRGRRFRVLSGRARAPRRTRLGGRGQAVWLVSVAALMVVSLGVPVFGAVSASLIDGLGSLAGTHRWSLANYVRVVQSPDLGSPLVYSAGMAAITATVALLLALACARVLAARSVSRAARLLDAVLLAAVALPGIVFAAGFIFAFNLPVLAAAGIQLYGSNLLLALAYLATALPSTTRLLVGSVAQVQENLAAAARVHGGGAIRTWLTISGPILLRPLVTAWLLTYAGTLLELPVSQLLAPAGSEPISVGITTALGKYDFGGGTAMEVLAILSALAVVGLAFGIVRVAAPRGWRRLGAAA
ncbi:MAG: iron ABC transporter permease [Acidobacteria bacterium]|nr:iron ABC transporter permease [Acidobacteriota bacterium]